MSQDDGFNVLFEIEEPYLDRLIVRTYPPIFSLGRVVDKVPEQLEKRVDASLLQRWRVGLVLYLRDEHAYQLFLRLLKMLWEFAYLRAKGSLSYPKGHSVRCLQWAPPQHH